MVAKMRGSDRTRQQREMLKQQVRELLQTEIRFVYSSEFERLKDDDRPVHEAQALLAQLQVVSTDGSHDADMPAEMDLEDTVVLRNWSAPDPLLTFDDEQVLFRGLNLLRFRINRIRSRLSEARPSAKAVATIQSMLEVVEQIRSQLVKSNLRLVSSIARKFSGSSADVDDFSSDGCMILLGAIDRFDYSRGFRFSTYATHSIQRHFYRAWKVRQKRKERFPNAVPELLSAVPQVEVEEPICHDPSNVVADLLSRADQLLDAREQQILVNRYGLGQDQAARTLREIASDLGISKERVRQLQMKALHKLRDLMDPDRLNMDSMFSAC